MYKEGLVHQNYLDCAKNINRIPFQPDDVGQLKGVTHRVNMVHQDDIFNYDMNTLNMEHELRKVNSKLSFTINFSNYSQDSSCNIHNLSMSEHHEDPVKSFRNSVMFTTLVKKNTQQPHKSENSFNNLDDTQMRHYYDDLSLS